MQRKTVPLKSKGFQTAKTKPFNVPGGSYRCSTSPNSNAEEFRTPLFGAVSILSPRGNILASQTLRLKAQQRMTFGAPSS